MEVISFKYIPESQTIFTDFLTAATIVNSDDKDYDRDDCTQFKTMSINTLRRKLCDKGLDIDGTREMVVTALEGSYAKCGEKRKREDETVDN